MRGGDGGGGGGGGVAPLLGKLRGVCHPGAQPFACVASVIVNVLQAFSLWLIVSGSTLVIARSFAINS